MTQEEMKMFAAKIQDNTATLEERIAFFKELNKILDSMNTILRSEEVQQQVQ